MPRCPECGEEISYLVYYEKVWQKTACELKGREMEYDGDWDVVSVLEQVYCCPECDAELFHREEDAKKFLAQ